MKKMGQKSQIFMKIGVILSTFSLLKGMGEVWECLNCICDVLLSSKLVLDLNLDQKWGSKRNPSPAGNWTPVSRSTGGILTTTLSRMRWCFAEFSNKLKTRHFYHLFPTSLDSSVGWAVDSSVRGPGFKSRQEQNIKFCCNIAFFDQKKGVYERDFALPSLRIPLRVPKL